MSAAAKDKNVLSDHGKAAFSVPALSSEDAGLILARQFSDAHA